MLPRSSSSLSGYWRTPTSLSWTFNEALVESHSGLEHIYDLELEVTSEWTGHSTLDILTFQVPEMDTALVSTHYCLIYVSPTLTQCPYRPRNEQFVLHRHGYHMQHVSFLSTIKNTNANIQ